jgi:hypothetical protein
MATWDPGRLGALIKNARDELGLSRREAEKLTTFSRTTWTSLETGTRIKHGGGEHEPARPKPYVIMEAAEVLGVDVNEALTLGGYDPRVYNPDNTPSLAQRIALLSSEQQAAVSWVVDAFLAADVPAEAQEAVENVVAAFLSADVPSQAQSATPRRAAYMSGHEAGRRHARMSGREHGKTRGPDDVPEPRVAGRS